MFSMTVFCGSFQTNLEPGENAESMHVRTNADPMALTKLVPEGLITREDSLTEGRTSTHRHRPQVIL